VSASSPAKPLILTDVEGTTSSIAFVKEVLFPYSRRVLAGFVRARGQDPAVRRWLEAARADAGACDDDALVAVLQGWIDADRKATPLKALQGLIWEEGYRTGDYAAHVYPDAVAVLRRWRAAGHLVYVYSSGSVQAQRLFFRHTTAGNLAPLLSGHFDTEVGAKRDPEAYRRIAQSVGQPPAAITFLSDIPEELDAARTTGLHTVLVDRREDYPVPRPAGAHNRVESFEEIKFG
jgi:enolase-phosphatase E1